jgi:protein-tyrosine phosphatase
MIDIHHHLLFDLDDGSRSLEMSIDMARMAVDDGITHIVCTPHANERFRFDPEVNRARLSTLEEALLVKGIGPLIFGLGCDFHLMYENVEDALRNPTRYTINEKGNGYGYLLVEFPEFSISPNTSATLYDLRLSGMTPIITHPERNPILVKQPERMAEWLSTGALIQITAASLHGRFGQQAQRTCDWLLERNWVHFVATDAHNLASRPPQLQTAHRTIAEKYGVATADRLCITNPRCAFDGLPLPQQPPLIDLGKELDPLPSEGNRKSGKPGLFGRLFSGNS